MDDVERLFRRLVDVLASREPARLQEPIAIGEIHQQIIPYRVHRTALRFDTNQDYEMALLRLLAGEHGLAEVESAEARERLAEETRSGNPDPGRFRAYDATRVRLNFRAVQDVLEMDASYAPPLPAVPLRPQGGEAAPASAPRPGGTPEATPAACPHCDAALPAQRTVIYCPFCGGNVKVRACPQCGTELEEGWRHCITCGYRAQ